MPHALRNANSAVTSHRLSCVRAVAGQRWNNRWKTALNEFDVLFGGRLSAERA